MGNHNPFRIIEIQFPMINPLSETNLLWLWSILIFVKIWYETTIPSVTCWHLKLTMKILHHLKSSITRFDMFRTIYNQNKNCNVWKWCVSGCKHFWDPTPETWYNSFAWRSDEVLLGYNEFPDRLERVHMLDTRHILTTNIKILVNKN